MKRFVIPFLLFLFLVLEGVALEILPASLVDGQLIIVPHWVFVILLFTAIFYDKQNTYRSIIYGILFGLLIDVVYTGVLGVYMFSYALVCYVIHGLRKLLHANFIVMTTLGVTGLIMVDSLINTIFMVVGISEMAWRTYLVYRLLPTVAANTIFLIVLYPFLNSFLVKTREAYLSKSNTFL